MFKISHKSDKFSQKPSVQTAKNHYMYVQIYIEIYVGILSPLCLSLFVSLFMIFFLDFLHDILIENLTLLHLLSGEICMV